ncbi:MAG TPA: hypothetical protein VL294_13330 [Pseudolysinimonas sp.]|jgi:hypothetical protein|nr:hypothetical protein [Pseudolysinimonas sp.]
MSTDARGDAPPIEPHAAAQGRASGLTESGEWVPQFEGQRPPFEQGNTAAEKHGAYSPRKIDAVARGINTELADRYAWATDYPEALTSMARVEAVARLLFGQITKQGANTPLNVFRTFLTAENSLGKLRESMGMTPQSEASVARDRAAAASHAVDVLGELAKRGAQTRAVTDQPDTDHPALAPEAVNHDDREDS